MYAIHRDEKKKVYYGKVNSVTNKDDGTAVIELEDYSGEVKAFYFQNTETDTRADRIKAMNLQVGAWIAIYAICSDETKGTATGLRAKYKGRWELKNKNGADTNILIGTAIHPKELRSGAYCVTMAVDETVEGKKQTVWYDITFFNGEKEDASAPNGKRTWSNADRARKVIAGSDKTQLCVVCGPLQERESNGKVYKGFIGYSLQRKPL